MSIVVSAEDIGANTRYNNLGYCYRGFYIQNDMAFITIRITGMQDTSSRTTAKITLEKRALLGLWWKEEASWEASTTETNPVIEFSKEVKSGTYRCNFEITIEGTGGNADVITDQITATN